MPKRMIIPIVCQFHLGADTDETDPTGAQLPFTDSNSAEGEGWRQTTHRLFSEDGRRTWICPRCVDSLRLKLIREKDDREAVLARGHNKTICALQRRHQRYLQDENRHYSSGLADAKRYYDKLFGELDGVPETQVPNEGSSA